MVRTTAFVLANPSSRLFSAAIQKCNRSRSPFSHAMPMATANTVNASAPNEAQPPRSPQKEQKHEKEAPQPRGNTLLLVGLGNPGPRFDNTRHNVGFDLVTEYARRNSGDSFRSNKYIQAEHTSVMVNGITIHIAKPTTFMNNSGSSVRAALRHFKIPTSALLVVADDIALDVGRLRLRARGSAGGHNGLKSIQSSVGGLEYARLKVGVGVPNGAKQWADFVLARFSRAEAQRLEEVTWDVMDVLDYWAREPDINRVSNKLGMIQSTAANN